MPLSGNTLSWLTATTIYHPLELVYNSQLRANRTDGRLTQIMLFLFYRIHLFEKTFQKGASSMICVQNMSERLGDKISAYLLWAHHPNRISSIERGAQWIVSHRRRSYWWYARAYVLVSRQSYLSCQWPAITGYTLKSDTRATSNS